MLLRSVLQQAECAVSATSCKGPRIVASVRCDSHKGSVPEAPHSQLVDKLISSLGIATSQQSYVQQLANVALTAPGAPQCIPTYPCLLEAAVSISPKWLLQPASPAEAQHAAVAIVYAAKADGSGAAVTAIAEALLHRRGQDQVIGTVLEQAMQSIEGQEQPKAASAIHVLAAIARWCRISYVRLSPHLRIGLLNAVTTASHLLMQGLRHPTQATRLLAGQLLAHVSETSRGQQRLQYHLVDLMAALVAQQDKTLDNTIVLTIRNCLEARACLTGVSGLNMVTHNPQNQAAVDKLVNLMVQDSNIQSAAIVHYLAKSALGQLTLAPHIPKLWYAASQHISTEIASCAVSVVTSWTTAARLSCQDVQQVTERMLTIAVGAAMSAHRTPVAAAACQALLQLFQYPISSNPAANSAPHDNWYGTVNPLATASSLGRLLKMATTSTGDRKVRHTWSMPWLTESGQCTLGDLALKLWKQLARHNASALNFCISQSPELLQTLVAAACGANNEAASNAADALSTIAPDLKCQLPHDAVLTLIQAATRPAANPLAAGRAASVLAHLASTPTGEAALQPHILHIMEALAATRQGMNTTQGALMTAIVAALTLSLQGFGEVLKVFKVAVHRLTDSNSSLDGFAKCANPAGIPGQPNNHGYYKATSTWPAMQLHQKKKTSAAAGVDVQGQGDCPPCNPESTGFAGSSDCGLQATLGPAETLAMITVICDVLNVALQAEAVPWVANPDCIASLVDAIVYGHHCDGGSNTSESAQQPTAAVAALPVLRQLVMKSFLGPTTCLQILAEKHLGALLWAMQQGNDLAAAALEAIRCAPLVQQQLGQPEHVARLCTVLMNTAADASAVIHQTADQAVRSHQPAATGPCYLGSLASTMEVPQPRLTRTSVVPGMLRPESTIIKTCTSIIWDLLAVDEGRQALIAHAGSIAETPVALLAANRPCAASSMLQAMVQLAEHPIGSTALLDSAGSILEALCHDSEEHAKLAFAVLKAAVLAGGRTAAYKLADEPCIHQLIRILKGQQDAASTGAAVEGGQPSSRPHNGIHLEAASWLLCRISADAPRCRFSIVPYAEILVNLIGQGKKSGISADTLESVACTILNITVPEPSPALAPAAASVSLPFDTFAAAATRRSISQLAIRPLVLAVMEQETYSWYCSAILHNLSLAPEGVKALLPYVSTLAIALQPSYDDDRVELMLTTLDQIAANGLEGRTAVCLELSNIVRIVNQSWRHWPDWVDITCDLIYRVLGHEDTRAAALNSSMLENLLPFLLCQVEAGHEYAAVVLWRLAQVPAPGPQHVLSSVGRLLDAIQPVEVEEDGQQQQPRQWKFKNNLTATFVISALCLLLESHTAECHSELVKHRSKIHTLLQGHPTEAEVAVFVADKDEMHPSDAAHVLVERLIRLEAPACSILQDLECCTTLAERLLDVVRKQSASVMRAITALQALAASPRGHVQLATPKSIAVLLSALSAGQDDPTARCVARHVMGLLRQLMCAAAAAGEVPAYTSQLLTTAKQQPQLVEPIFQCLALLTTYRAGQLHLAQQMKDIVQAGDAAGVTAAAKAVIVDVRHVIEVALNDLSDSLKQSRLDMEQKAVLLSRQYRQYLESSPGSRTERAAAVMEQMTLFCIAHAAYSKLCQQYVAAEA